MIRRYKRPVLLSLAWIVSAAALYVPLVALEFYWNLYDWEPRADLLGFGLALTPLGLSAIVWLLARASRDRVSQAVSCLVCVLLLALAVYVLPPEPLTDGLFSRQAPSPLWYRGARALVLFCPAAFWVYYAWQRRRSKPRPALLCV